MARRKLHDRFFKQAKREGRLARSFYKIEEINRRNRLFGKGDRVLDLGAAPGSWLEYVLETVGPRGVVCAADVQPIHRKFKGRVTFRKADALDLAPDAFADAAGAFDAVLSDMAPRTSGVKTADQARSLALCRAALRIARGALRPGGRFVCKAFDGPDLPDFRRELAECFETVKLAKPAASRDESMEMYVLGLAFRGASEG